MLFPTVHLLIEAERSGSVYFKAKWRRRMPDGTLKQIKRTVGPAWMQRVEGEWVKRRGRPTEGFLTRDLATSAAQTIMESEETAFAAALDRAATPTVGDLFDQFLDHRQDVKGLRPGTIRDYRSVLSSPTVAALRDLPANEVTPAEVERVLVAVGKAGAGPRTVNKYRAIMSSAYEWGRKATAMSLPANPVLDTETRREPPRQSVEWFSVEEVEQLARCLAAGAYRPSLEVTGPAASFVDFKQEQRDHFDPQDAELVRIAAYAGLRLNEIIALRWRDVDFGNRRINVRNTFSGGEEVDGPKSGKYRSVTMSDRALAALNILSRRLDFAGPADRVAVNLTGDRLSARELTKRYTKARDHLGFRPLPFHKLRHTFGSQLARGGIELGDIQAEMGHAHRKTTEIYLHTKSRADQAQRISAAQQPDVVPTSPGTRKGIYKISITNTTRATHPNSPESQDGPSGKRTDPRTARPG